MKNIEYLIGPTGISILLGLCAYGSCSGMSLCGCSSTLYADKGKIVTYSYVAMIMISTVFFYGFILAIITMNKITDNYKYITSIWHLSACTLFGMVGCTAGISMGKISQSGFRRIAERGEFFMSFLIALASVEVTLVLAFLCSLLMIYHH
ncbi:hypothetical protein EHP00_469 [Ecytonucleospora hepatopenaei]|uniref:V-ATPase proteolipid subunit C-like domain-containing protein n=1 Tax=Ecytonucleospora hepatopenaei TaxID=646526 RepID=A0A1W0E8Z3_9MICR|nr:hypothetical protein EHP00_469 [Ecytonucleospora hepatopenaei]